MRQPNITVYGSRQCADTTRALEQLDAESWVYEFKDVDTTPEYDGYLADQNGGHRELPTIRVDDHVLVNPDRSSLDEAVRASASVND